MNNFSRFIAFFISLTILFGLLSVVPAQAAAKNIPVICIRGDAGQAQPKYKGENGESFKLYDDGEYASAIVKAALPYAITALATGNWDKWSEKAFEQLKPAYEHFKPDEHGFVDERSLAEARIAPEKYTFKDQYEVNGTYEIFPDMRYSPMDEADYIKKIIEQIKKVTGSSKVILIGQCMGNAHLMAYLHKYEEQTNFADIESIVLSTTTSNGLVAYDALLSGNVKFQKDSFYKFGYKYDYPDAMFDMAGGELIQLLYRTLDLAYQSKGLGNVTIDVVQNVYEKIKDNFLARIFKEYYGRCGGYVTAIDEHYDDYLEYVFPTDEDKQLYSEQIEKFNYYRNNVQLRQSEIIGELQSNGISVSCIAQYGIQLRNFAAGEKTLETSDRRVLLSDSSFGATTVNIGDTLSDEYIAQRSEEGFGKYISPDNQVDASTCLLPDSTWFIKNAMHVFDKPVMALATAIVRTDHPTVEKLEEQGFSRFMYYTDEATPLQILTAEHTDDAENFKPASKNVFQAFVQWIKQFFALMKNLIGGLFKK